MKRHCILGVLFFSSLWGLSEALLGGWMYAGGDVLRQGAPVVLSVIAFAVLTVARVYVPLPGSSTAIASMALLFKFLIPPFFGCHLLAIFLLGAAYDVAASTARGRARYLIGPAATYLGFALFAIIITYVVRYGYWASVGLPKVLSYVLLTGTITAVCNTVVVPLSDRLGRAMSARTFDTVPARLWAIRAASLATAGLWVFAATRQF